MTITWIWKLDSNCQTISVIEFLWYGGGGEVNSMTLPWELLIVVVSSIFDTLIGVILSERLVVNISL